MMSTSIQESARQLFGCRPKLFDENGRAHQFRFRSHDKKGIAMV